MVQYFPASSQSLMRSTLSQSLGKGLSDFATNYYANKAIEKVMNEPGLRDRPLSERYEKLEGALRPFGEYGQNILNRRLGIEQQRQGEQMFEKAKGIAKDPKAKASDIILSLLQASQGVPDAGRTLGPAIEALMTQRKIEGGQSFREGDTRGRDEGFIRDTMPQRQELPTFGFTPQEMQQTNVYPSNVLGKEFPGSMPQTATTGQVRPIPTPEQQLQEAKELSSRMNVPLEQTIPIVRENVQNIRDYNQNVAKENEQRIAAQEKYGTMAKEKLLKVFPGATDSQLAAMAKKGEQAASTFKSQGEIERYLAEESNKFADTVSRVRKSIPPARIYNQVIQRARGNETTIEQNRADVRSKLQPLLKDGFYDTARNLLSEAGYYPEEREAILTDLSEGTVTKMASLPDFKEPYFPEGKLWKPSKGMPDLTAPLSNEDFETAYNTIKDVLLDNKNENLILLRKASEDKGINWRNFKDILNRLEVEGLFSYNDDQRKMQNLLEEPPLGPIETILHSLRIIGR